MTTSDDDERDAKEETRVAALDAARRAVQFLESGQATGAFILLTDGDRAVLWDTQLTPDVHPIGEAANVLAEMSNRLRQVWYRLISDDEDGRGFLRAISDDDKKDP